jgi:hypothetical protein
MEGRKIEKGLGYQGSASQNAVWVEQRNRNPLAIFSANLNLNSKFKFTPNTFLNLDKFKYFPKTEI